MSCAWVRVCVAQPIVDLHFCRCTDLLWDSKAATACSVIFFWNIAGILVILAPSAPLLPAGSGGIYKLIPSCAEDETIKSVFPV